MTKFNYWYIFIYVDTQEEINQVDKYLLKIPTDLKITFQKATLDENQKAASLKLPKKSMAEVIRELMVAHLIKLGYIKEEYDEAA